MRVCVLMCVWVRYGGGVGAYVMTNWKKEKENENESGTHKDARNPKNKHTRAAWLPASSSSFAPVFSLPLFGILKTHIHIRLYADMGIAISMLSPC